MLMLDPKNRKKIAILRYRETTNKNRERGSENRKNCDKSLDLATLGIEIINSYLTFLHNFGVRILEVRNKISILGGPICKKQK